MGRGAPSSIEVGVQDGGPTWESLLLSTPLYPNLFGPSLGLTLLEGVGFSSFHHLFTLLLPFPFEVGGFKSDGQGGWRLALDPHIIWYGSNSLVVTGLGWERMDEITS